MNREIIGIARELDDNELELVAGGCCAAPPPPPPPCHPAPCAPCGGGGISLSLDVDVGLAICL